MQKTHREIICKAFSNGLRANENTWFSSRKYVGIQAFWDE
jgi:hypothetical protein